MRDADHPHARVTVGRPVRRQLLQVRAVARHRRRSGRIVGAETRLLDQLARGGGTEVLVRAHEAAGQRPTPLVRRFPRRTTRVQSAWRRTVSTTRSTVTAKGGKADGS